MKHLYQFDFNGFKFFATLSKKEMEKFLLENPTFKLLGEMKK
jgi:hypothetical protein